MPAVLCCAVLCQNVNSVCKHPQKRIAVRDDQKSDDTAEVCLHALYSVFCRGGGGASLYHREDNKLISLQIASLAEYLSPGDVMKITACRHITRSSHCEM
jgi:hypothetical protein